jgi:hypothetical protein
MGDIPAQICAPLKYGNTTTWTRDWRESLWLEFIVTDIFDVAQRIYERKHIRHANSQAKCPARCRRGIVDKTREEAAYKRWKKSISTCDGKSNGKS